MTEINVNPNVQCLVNMANESELPSQVITVFARSSKQHAVLHYPNGWLAFLGGLVVNNPPADTGGGSWIPGLGRSHCRRKWQPTTVFFLGKSHGQRSLAASVPGVSKSRTWLSNQNNNNGRLCIFCWLIPAGFHWGAVFSWTNWKQCLWELMVWFSERNS